ncbi:MAG: PEP-CTERM sorting domain-containing protein, partial [Acidobacteria bacterium]|nr:PEP-CTERM sorting domain-containing protein [Acidobacteriota bacterium]
FSAPGDPFFSVSNAAQTISLTAGLAADLIDALAHPANNYTSGVGSHSVKVNLTATGDRKPASKWLRIIALIADIVVDPPPSPYVTEGVGIAIGYNGEILLSSKFRMVWNSLLNKWELEINDSTHTFSPGMFTETIDPVKHQTTFALTTPVTLSFDRLLAPGTMTAQVSETLYAAGALIPEPGTLLLAASGLLVVAILRRRNRAVS